MPCSRWAGSSASRRCRCKQATSGTLDQRAGLPRFDLVELNDTIESRDVDKQAKRFSFDPAASDHGSTPAKRSSTRPTPQHGLYLAGERHLTFFHPAAGQRIPMPGVQFHFGKLTEPLGGGRLGDVPKSGRLSSGSPADSTFSRHRLRLARCRLADNCRRHAGAAALSPAIEAVLRRSVQTPASASVIGKTDGAIDKGSSGTVNVYNGTAGSEADSGSTITAYNPFADVADGKWVAALQINGQWYLIAAEC